MIHRSAIPPQLRSANSRLHQLLVRGSVMRGSLVQMRTTCGKENCRCAKGHRHEALYLRQSVKGKPRMRMIPAQRQAEVRDMVARYKQAKELLEEISNYEWEHLREER
jgi:hypothetical protein